MLTDKVDPHDAPNRSFDPHTQITHTCVAITSGIQSTDICKIILKEKLLIRYDIRYHIHTSMLNY